MNFSNSVGNMNVSNSMSMPLPYNLAIIVSIVNIALICYFFYKTDMNVLKGLFSFFREHEIAKKYFKDTTIFWKYFAACCIPFVIFLIIIIAAITRNFGLVVFCALLIIACMIFAWYYLYKIYSKVFVQHKMRKSYGLFFVIPGISIIGWILLVNSIKDKNIISGLLKKKAKK